MVARLSQSEDNFFGALPAYLCHQAVAGGTLCFPLFPLSLLADLGQCGRGPLVEKLLLMFDDRLSHFGQRAPTLFDRIDQPLRAADFLFDEFPFFRSAGRILQPSPVILTDVQRGHAIVVQ